MNSRPTVPEPVSLPVRSIHFPAIFDTAPNDGRFGVAVPFADVEAAGAPLSDVLAETILKAKGTTWGLVNFRSSRKPRVYDESGDPAALISLWAEADAMNIPRSSLLIERPAILHLCFWEKTRNFQHGTIGVSLNAITIDAKRIKIPGPLDEIYTAED